MVRPELACLPMAQTIWYMPTGLDPWNQLLGKAPGHYTRLYQLDGAADPPPPEVHWPDQEPLALDGPLRRAAEPLADAGPARRGGARRTACSSVCSRTRPTARQLLAQLVFAGLIDVQDRMLLQPLVHDRPQGVPRARDGRAGRGDRLGQRARRGLRRRARHGRRPALVLDLRDGAATCVLNLLDGRDRELLAANDGPLTPAEQAVLVDAAPARHASRRPVDALVGAAQGGQGPAADPRHHPARGGGADPGDAARRRTTRCRSTAPSTATRCAGSSTRFDHPHQVKLLFVAARSSTGGAPPGGRRRERRADDPRAAAAWTPGPAPLLERLDGRCSRCDPTTAWR